MIKQWMFIINYNDRNSWQTDLDAIEIERSIKYMIILQSLLQDINQLIKSYDNYYVYKVFLF